MLSVGGLSPFGSRSILHAREPHGVDSSSAQALPCRVRSDLNEGGIEVAIMLGAQHSPPDSRGGPGGGFTPFSRPENQSTEREKKITSRG